MGAYRGVRHPHFRDGGISLGNDPEHLDRPAFRIAAVELDEVRAAADTDSRIRPLEDEVLGKQHTDCIPVPRLNPAQKLFNNVAGIHGPMIRVKIGSKLERGGGRMRFNLSLSARVSSDSLS